MTMVKATLEQIIERKFVFKLKHSMKVPTHPRVRENVRAKEMTIKTVFQISP